jgi:single-strand DNA-binding protein
MADTTVSITGNLTRDPELRFTANGKPVANLGVACNRLVSKPGEERREEVSFYDVTCWDSLATNVADALTKGDRVVITGRLQQRSWETDEGDKRSKVEIVADEVGASLRWATVEISKNARPEANGENTPASVGAGEETF